MEIGLDDFYSTFEFLRVELLNMVIKQGSHPCETL